LLRTRVKVCGTTNADDAMLAAELGVDALGFIFFPKSPRNIAFTDAAAIIRNLPILIDRVGVFVNPTLDMVREGVSTGLSVLQLHGTEPPELCRELKTIYPGCRIIKAFRVGDQTQAVEFTPYASVVDAYLLDTYVKGSEGGTGLVFDWSIIKKLDLQLPFLLAGGLNVDNISEAVCNVNPYAVDVNSGIESAPGKKDHNALRQLMHKIAQAAVSGHGVQP